MMEMLTPERGANNVKTLLRHLHMLTLNLERSQLFDQSRQRHIHPPTSINKFPITLPSL